VTCSDHVERDPVLQLRLRGSQEPLRRATTPELLPRQADHVAIVLATSRALAG
jgi:hypothetical protein